MKEAVAVAGQNSFVPRGAMDSSPTPYHESVIIHAFTLAFML